MFLKLAKQYLDEKLKNGNYDFSPTEETAIACFAEWLNKNAAQHSVHPTLATSCENHILYVACGYKYCPNCGNPLGG